MTYGGDQQLSRQQIQGRVHARDNPWYLDLDRPCFTASKSFAEVGRAAYPTRTDYAVVCSPNERLACLGKRAAILAPAEV